MNFKHKNIWDISFSENIRNCILGQDKACFDWKQSDFRAQIDFWTISVVFLTGSSAARRRHAIAIPVTIAPYYLSNSGAAIVAFVSLVLCAMCMLHAGTKLQSTTFITVSLLQPKQILICWFYDASFSTLVWPIDMLYFICMHVWWKLRLMHFWERCSYLHMVYSTGHSPQSLLW